jgi:hypothetical protein
VTVTGLVGSLTGPLGPSLELDPPPPQPASNTPLTTVVVMNVHMDLGLVSNLSDLLCSGT